MLVVPNVLASTVTVAELWLTLLGLFDQTNASNITLKNGNIKTENQTKPLNKTRATDYTHSPGLPGMCLECWPDSCHTMYRLHATLDLFHNL